MNQDRKTAAAPKQKAPAARSRRAATRKTPARRDRPPDISVLVPAKDEAEVIAPVIEELGEVLAPMNFEVIIVDDGSSDGTQEVIRGMMEGRTWLRLVSHDRCSGQSAALRSGIAAARGGIIVTMDGDGQSDPRDFAAMVEKLQAGGPELGMVTGQRVKRRDTWIKRVSSRIANSVRGAILGDSAPDSGCPVRAARRETLAGLPYFDHMHRFMPALVRREGLKVETVPVRHRERMAGRSKYGTLDRLAVGIVDLFGVWWLLRRRKQVPQVREISP